MALPVPLHPSPSMSSQPELEIGGAYDNPSHENVADLALKIRKAEVISLKSHLPRLLGCQICEGLSFLIFFTIVCTLMRKLLLLF